MKNIVIFGSGDHAKVIFYEIIKINKYNIIGFIDNKNVNAIITLYKKKKYKILGKISEFKDKKINFCGIIGVGSNFIREKILIEVEKNIKDFSWEKCAALTLKKYSKCFVILFLHTMIKRPKK